MKQVIEDDKLCEGEARVHTKATTEEAASALKAAQAVVAQGSQHGAAQKGEEASLVGFPDLRLRATMQILNNGVNYTCRSDFIGGSCENIKFKFLSGRHISGI